MNICVRSSTCWKMVWWRLRGSCLRSLIIRALAMEVAYVQPASMDRPVEGRTRPQQPSCLRTLGARWLMRPSASWALGKPSSKDASMVWCT